MPLLSYMEIEGMERGQKIGKEIGLLEKASEAVAMVLGVRFEFVPSEISEALGKISDLSVLDELLKIAVTIHSLEEFKQKVFLDLK